MGLMIIVGDWAMTRGARNRVSPKLMRQTRGCARNPVSRLRLSVKDPLDSNLDILKSCGG